MKGFKKLTAFALSATMLMGTSLTALAADPTTGAATGNILDYKVQLQVVPTSLKLAVNPNGYAVNVRYAKLASDATFTAGTKYYTEADGVYTIDKTVTADNFATKKATLYTATTKSDQIVTFNYGLVNESTVDRKISVKFDVVADAKVEFVDSAAKTTAEAQENDGGAKTGEYKIFLQLVPAKVGETPATSEAYYIKASGTYDSSGTYYTKSGDVYTKVDSNSETDFKAGNYYVATTTIGTEIQAKNLADVTMVNSTVPIPFATGTGTTSAEVAFKLGKATYALKADEYIDFDTTTALVGDKFEITGIGGISAFTFIGTMNTNTEWAQLGTKTITITPTYRFEDATGLETAVTTGLNQVEATPANTAPSVTTTDFAILEANKTATINVSLGSGTLKATAVKAVNWNGTNLLGSTFTYSDGVLTVGTTSVNYALNNPSDATYQIVFNDEAETKVNVTLTAKQ